MRYKKAITLLENTVYLTLFGVAFIVIVQFGIRINEYQRLSLNRGEMQKSLIIINEELLDVAERASTIDQSSDFDLNNGTLIFNTASGDISFSVQNNRLVRTETADQSIITLQSQIVQEFIFTEIENADNEIIGVELSITLAYDKNPGVTESLSTIYVL